MRRTTKTKRFQILALQPETQQNNPHSLHFSPSLCAMSVTSEVGDAVRRRQRRALGYDTAEIRLSLV